MHQWLRRLFVFLFLLIPIGVLVAWYFFVGFHRAEGDQGNNGGDGIWLQHAWVEDPLSTAEWNELGQNLSRHDIRYAYLHTGPFESDGTLSVERYPYAKAFLAYMKKHFPEIQWYAWMGQRRSRLDIDQSGIRKEMVATVSGLIQEVGFDGIHYNIEPIRARDAGFLSLLRETRLALPTTPISIAVDEWQPEALSRWVGDYFGVEVVSYISTRDLEAMMPLVDQVVVMAYDTSLGGADWYRWFIEQQVIYVTRIAEPFHTSVLVGIPAYEKGAEGAFDPAIENIENGLKGVIQGVSNTRSAPEVFSGVAIYPYWEMEEEEWKTYETLWQNKEKSL